LTCLSQDLKLDFPFTVQEVAFLGRTPHLPRIGRESSRDWEIVRNAMELADIASLADRPVTEISGGERQRVFISMCLAQEPRLLLLDEPTSHLDVGHQLSILRLIRKLNVETGLTVIAVFHDLNLASEFCGRLLVMHQGKVEADGEPTEVLTVEMIRKVYGTEVLTERNPVSGRPHIVVTAVSESERAGAGSANGGGAT
jgi:iron complex transport system ATP-binding protein